MRKFPDNLYSLTFLSACVLGLMLVFNATAATDTWTGGAAPDGSWTDAGNWGGIAPGANDLLNFAGSVQTTATNDFSAGTIFNNLAFVGGAGTFTLNGNFLVLTNVADVGNGTTFGGSISNLSANAETIGLPLTLSVGKHFIGVTAAGQLNLGGTITRNPGAVAVFQKTTTGNINLTGSGLTTNGFNNILGGWATFGGDWASLDAGANVIPLASGSYTVVAPGGNIASNSASNIKVSAGATTAITTDAGTCDVNTLLYSAGGGNQTITIGAGNTLRLGAQGGIYNATGLGTARQFIFGAAGVGTLTAGGADNTPGEITVYDGPLANTANNVTLNSVVADNGSGAVRVNILGYMAWGNTANSFSGGTYVLQGRSQSGNAGCYGYGPVHVFPGGQVSFAAAGTWTNDFYLAGVGSTENNGLGALRMGGINRVLSGTITLVGTAAIGPNRAFTAGGPFPTITGKITGPGSLIVGSGNNGNGSGVLIIGNGGSSIPNDYAGDTKINNAGVAAANMLQIAPGSPAIMPHGAGKGNLILNALSATITAQFDLNGTPQTINGLSSTGISPANNIVTDSTGGGVLTVGDNDATSTFGGVIQNAMGLVKIGNGTLTLTGANTYSGGTVINGGELDTTTLSSGGDFTVADSTTLGVAVGSSGGTLNMNNVTFGSAGSTTLDVDASTFGNPVTPPVNIFGSLVLNGNVAVNISGSSLAAGTFTVLTYPPGQRSGAGAFVLGAFPPRASGVTLNDDTANNQVTITIGSIDSGIKWNGDVSGDWNINQSVNTIWAGVPSGGSTYYMESAAGNDAVLFDDTATGTTTVNLATNVAPAVLTVDNTTKNYTFSGPGKITGTTGLSKSGTGLLTLSGSGGDSFSGGITIAPSGGTVILDSAGSSISGTATVGAGSTLQIGSNDANGSVPSGGAAVDGSLIFNRNDGALTVAGVISGGGTVTQNGPGTVTLTAIEAYTGSTTVNGGVLVLNHGNSQPSTLTASSGLFINTNAIVKVGIDNSLAGSGGTVGALPVTINAGGLLTGLEGDNNGAGTSTHIRGLLTLNGGTLSNSGTSIDNVHGAWNLDNGVDVNTGPNYGVTSTINCLSVIPHQTGGTIFNVNPGATPSGIDLLVSGTFINGSSTHDTTLIKNGTGTMALDNNNNYISGTIINSGVLQLGMVNDANALVSPLGTGAVTINTAATLKFASSQGVTVANVINDDGTGIVLASSGTNFLTAVNNYSGPTVVQNSTLALTGEGSINNSTVITVSNATLDVSASSSSVVSPGALAVTQGTFDLGTNLVTSLGSLALSNATLVLPVNTDLPGITTTALATGGATNLINLTSVPGLPVYPTNLTLIKYSTPASGLVNGNNVLTTLGVKLPVAGNPVGYLTNNVANGSIDLLLVSGPSAVNPNPTNLTATVSGNLLTLSWPEDHTGWTLQVQTNSLSTGLNTNWFNVPGSTLVNTNVVTINAENGAVFYRLMLQ